MYVPGVVWLEFAALLMRETHGPAGVLPSILMLVITVAVVAFALPRAWVAAASMKRAQSESTPEAVPVQTEPDETTDPGSPQ